MELGCPSVSGHEPECEDSAVSGLIAKAVVAVGEWFRVSCNEGPDGARSEQAAVPEPAGSNARRARQCGRGPLPDRVHIGPVGSNALTFCGIARGRKTGRSRRGADAKLSLRQGPEGTFGDGSERISAMSSTSAVFPSYCVPHHIWCKGRQIRPIENR